MAEQMTYDDFITNNNLYSNIQLKPIVAFDKILFDEINKTNTKYYTIAQSSTQTKVSNYNLLPLDAAKLQLANLYYLMKADTLMQNFITTNLELINKYDTTLLIDLENISYYDPLLQPQFKSNLMPAQYKHDKSNLIVLIIKIIIFNNFKSKKKILPIFLLII